MPNLSDFYSPNLSYSSISPAQFISGFLTLQGTTYQTPTFSSGVPTNDPGGLFGWLVYSRAELANPVKGLTSDTYIYYSDVADFFQDINRIGDASTSLKTIFNDNSDGLNGYTYSFFYIDTPTSTEIKGTTTGYDFLHCLNYLSGGGQLVIAGTTTGLYDYGQNNTSYTSSLKVLIGQTADASRAKFLETNNYIFGVFPTVQNGSGYTAAPFDTLFGSTGSVVNVAGATVANRIINVYGTAKFALNTPSWKTNSKLVANINMTSDLASSMAYAYYSSAALYLSPAGPLYSNEWNTIYNNTISPTNTVLINLFKKNRVNFYIAGSGSKFMYSDLVGATAGASSSFETKDRIGPNFISEAVEQSVTGTLYQYTFRYNDQNLRNAVKTSVVNTILAVAYASQYISSYTVTCDSTNNQDGSPTLVVDVSIKPFVSNQEFSLRVAVETGQSLPTGPNGPAGPELP